MLFTLICLTFILQPNEAVGLYVSSWGIVFWKDKWKTNSFNRKKEKETRSMIKGKETIKRM